MSLIINHNLSALNTHRNLSASGSGMSKSIEKLSSGYKINVGGDDPSGLIISEQLRSQISGLERAVRNSSEAFNLIGIAEGALNEMNTILKKMRALAIHAANSGVTSPEQVAADQSEMDSGIETLNRIANTTRYSDQYLLNGQKQLVYDVTTVVNEPTDHSLLDTKMTRIDQVFKRDGVKMSVGFSGEKNKYQANTDTSAQRAYLEADNAYSLCEIDGGVVTAKQEFILTGTSGSRLFSFAQGAHIGTIVENINNVRDSTGIGAALTFASDVRIDQTTNGTPNGSSPSYLGTGTPAESIKGYDDGTYIYQRGDVQIYGAGLNNVSTAKISEFTMTPDAASAFKVGFNTDGDGKIYAKVVDKSTNSIEYYKDRNCTMLIGKGDDTFFAASNNSGIPSSPLQNLDGVFLKLNTDNAQDLDVYEIAVIGQRLDNQKDMDVDLAGWSDTDNSVMSGVNLGVNTDPEGGLFFDYIPVQFEADGETVKTFEVNVYMHPSRQPKYLVATSGVVENNVKIQQVDASGKIIQLAGQTVRVEAVTMDDGTNSGLNFTLNLPKPSDLVGVTGMTVDEIKATDEYKKVMADLATAKSLYAEISDEYTAAQKSRNTAVATLETARAALENSRKEEAKLRREVDRLEARDIDAQKIDAELDLELSKSAMAGAARSAILDEALYTDFMKVAKAFADEHPENPDYTPEVLAENMAEEVWSTIIGHIESGIPAVLPDWTNHIATPPAVPANPSTQDDFRNLVKGKTPLAGVTLTADETAALDRILNAAYNAATEPSLINDVADAQNLIETMSTLQADYDAAKLALDNMDVDFDSKVQAAVQSANTTAWFTITTAANTTLANSIMAAIQNHIAGGTPPNYTSGVVVTDPTVDFKRYDWSTVKETLLNSLTYTYTSGIEAQERALASDMFETIVNDGDIAKYGNAVRDLYANPDGSAGTATAAIGTKVNAIPNSDPNVDDIITALAAGVNGKAFPDFVSELEALIMGEASTIISTATATTTTASALANLRTAVDTEVAAAISSPAASSAFQDINSKITAPGAEDAVDGIVASIWSSLTGAGGELYTYIDQSLKYKTAFDAAITAELAIGLGDGANDIDTVLNLGTGSPATAGTPVLDAVAQAGAALSVINLAAIDGPPFTPPATVNPLSDAISTELANQLVTLAREGVDVSNTANLEVGTANGDSIISEIVNAIKNNPVTTGITPAVLREYVTNVYNEYLDTAGTNTSGEFDAYTEAVQEFALYAEQLPGGGKIPRAEDRLARYAQRLEDAPLNAKTSATTRNAWKDLIADYGFATNIDAALTQLAEDFGKLVLTEVMNAAKATPQTAPEIINWNDGTPNSIYGKLLNMMTGNATQPSSTAMAALEAAFDADEATGTPADAERAAAGRAGLRKIIDKMFTAVTNPTYMQSTTGTPTPIPNPPPALTPGGYVPVSPVDRYFDQYNLLNGPGGLNDQLVLKTAEKENKVDEIDQKMLDLEDAEITLREEEAHFAAMSLEADPLLDEIALQQQNGRDLLRNAGGGKVKMPSGNQGGGITFTNLGMRLYAVDYGSAETIRIQNKAGNLFYQYREPDSMEKLMVEPDKTVQVAGQDAQISLNGAPVFTTGLVADTTTPDFSGSLVFNAGTLGETTLAIAGYDTGKLFSKATALQGVEENEADIVELRRHFEPPAVVVPMGDEVAMAGMLNENGKPVNLYMDFSQLDPSVEVKIDNFNQPCDILVKFEEPDQLTIDASSLGLDSDNQMVFTVKVNPDDLRDGYYVTNPALKGLFIRTDNLVDLNRSGGQYTPPDAPKTTPSAGETMLEVTTYATNPRSNTSESLENFLGGMQFQLGNTEGDQDRTVYSIQSMAMSELGRISWNGQEYCLQNVLGGGLASLTKDPILAMRVLEQAVDDVSTLRARLGAFQSNMLQSNINSLGVAIENITKTESAIRDTDMAEESTQFTRFQIMQQAGTSMLAQANQVSQNVLSLLQ